MKIHHIGYLVHDIKKAMEKFLQFGFVVDSKITYDGHRDIDIMFLKNETILIELVAPKSESSQIYKHYKKCGAGPYHICYEVENIDDTLAKMLGGGSILIHPPQEAPALNNSKVAFIYNTAFGIAELVEKSEQK